MTAAIPEQRQAQERLWRALTRLEYLDDLDERSQAELELMVAWTEYETARAS